MSDRDPRYNPIELLTNATEADTETAVEWSALYNFQKIAEEQKQERAKLASLIEFTESAPFAGLQPAFKELIQSQIKDCTENAKRLFNQLLDLSHSEILKPVIERTYEKVLEADLATVRKEQKEEFQRKLQETAAEYQRKQQVPIIQVAEETAIPPHFTNPKPILGKLILTLFISIFVLVCMICYYENRINKSYDAGYNAAMESTQSHLMSVEEWRAAKEEAATKAALMIQPAPANGTILSGKEYSGSEITVTADGGSSYVVSLKTANGIDRLSFFVRAGETVTVGVPSEYLYVYFACGNSWYGYGEGLMFGAETVYTKDDDLLDFTQYTWEYTLYPVYDGNFSETPSNEGEFFG